jgi:uncharacterized Tic20 family protein
MSMAGDDFARTDARVEAAFRDTELTSGEKTWAMLCHVTGLAGYLGLVPFASIIGPLIVWLLKKDTSAFVDEHGKESLNFQITMSIAYAIIIVLCFVFVGFLLLPLWGLWLIVLVVVAAIKASNGEHFRYPLTIRFVK